MTLVEEPSNTGDKCHIDIREVKDNKAGNFAKSYFKPPNIFMCCSGEETKITSEQYSNLLNNLCQ